MIFADRDLLEKGTRAFVASVRSYKEHRCEYVFQYQTLNLSNYAKAFHLLRVPKMKELREGKIPGFIEEKQQIVEQIPFLNKTREKQRQIKLEAIRIEKEQILKARKLLRKSKPMNEIEKKKKKEKDELNGIRGKKRKKQSKGSKYWNEKNMVWDDVAEEERLAKRLKKGKITQSEFDSELAALDKRTMNNTTRSSKAIGATTNKRRMVPKMMAKQVQLETQRRTVKSKNGNQHRNGYGDDGNEDDEDDDAKYEEIEKAKEVLRLHSERVVAAKRKHRFATKNIK
tara:strand:- start:213 stop:1067 length:855 start_codon:yes stop_codon:yes gene_type:complete